jgi:hypothetical protein
MRLLHLVFVDAKVAPNVSSQSVALAARVQRSSLRPADVLHRFEQSEFTLTGSARRAVCRSVWTEAARRFVPFVEVRRAASCYALCAWIATTLDA